MPATMEDRGQMEQQLEELGGKVDHGFERVDIELKRLNGKVDEGFARVDKDFRRVDTDFKRLEARMDEGFARVDNDIRELRGDIRGLRGEIGEVRREARIDTAALRTEMNERFEALNRRLVGGAIGLVVAIVGAQAAPL